MFWKRNSLSIVLLALSLLFMTGQALSGHQAYNEELRQQGLAALPMWQYLHSGHFIGALFENWESEFLQMGMYVVLTVKLRQWGSAESRPLSPGQEDDVVAPGPAPWPVRAGGIWLALYERSLALAFGALFLLSFVLHALGSWRHEVAEQAMQHQPPPSFWEHVSGAQFWFESMQNWQSEFLAVFALVVLSIWLRQKDSPQSKPVHAPHRQTGD